MRDQRKTSGARGEQGILSWLYEMEMKMLFFLFKASVSSLAVLLLVLFWWWVVASATVLVRDFSKNTEGAILGLFSVLMAAFFLGVWLTKKVKRLVVWCFGRKFPACNGQRVRWVPYTGEGMIGVPSFQEVPETCSTCGGVGRVIAVRTVKK